MKVDLLALVALALSSADAQTFRPNFNINAYSVRQKIACDICVQKVKSCDSYTPTALQFNPTRPAPSMLGKLAVCEASEREIWTTNDYFKVAVAGYNVGYDKMNFPPETRSKCPTSENAKPKFEGKLGFVRKTLCPLFAKKLDAKNSGSEAYCTKFMQTVAPSGNGANPTSCKARIPATWPGAAVGAPQKNVVVATDGSMTVDFSDSNADQATTDGEGVLGSAGPAIALPGLFVGIGVGVVVAGIVLVILMKFTKATSTAGRV